MHTLRQINQKDPLFNFHDTKIYLYNVFNTDIKEDLADCYLFNIKIYIRILASWKLELIFTCFV